MEDDTNREKQLEELFRRLQELLGVKMKAIAPYRATKDQTPPDLDNSADDSTMFQRWIKVVAI